MLAATLDKGLHFIEQMVVALLLQGFVFVDFLLLVDAMAHFDRVGGIDSSWLWKGSALRGMRLLRQSFFLQEILFGVFLWGRLVSEVSGLYIGGRPQVGRTNLILVLLPRSQRCLLGYQLNFGGSFIRFLKIPLLSFLLTLNFLLFGDFAVAKLEDGSSFFLELRFMQLERIRKELVDPRLEEGRLENFPDGGPFVGVLDQQL